MDDELREALLNLRHGGRQLMDLAEAYQADEDVAVQNRDRIVQLVADITEAGRTFKG